MLNNVIYYVNIGINILMISLIDPACQEINTTFNCYVSDPTCSRQLVAEKSDYDDVILYTSSILGGLILIVFVSVCIILGYLYREKNQTKRKGIVEFYNFTNLTIHCFVIF